MSKFKVKKDLGQALRQQNLFKKIIIREKPFKSYY